jgi:hypothetical protein
MTAPLVSVLMPVYNGAPWLAEAIDSVLGQSFADFELIIINDGSKDNSGEIVKAYKDPRIQYHEQKNRGLAGTLNRAIELSRGKYLARQDQDDVSRPNRFQRQIDYLDQHPDCGLVGTWAEIWVDGRPTGRTHRHPTESALIKVELLFNNPFVHSSVMIRKSCLESVGVYSVDPARQPPEDYELWSRIARKHEVANIPELLLMYREVGTSMSRSAGDKWWDRLITISSENLAAGAGGSIDMKVARGAARLLLGLDISKEPVRLYACASMLRQVTSAMSRSYPSHHARIARRLRTIYRSIVHQYYRQRMGRWPAAAVAIVRAELLYA